MTDCVITFQIGSGADDLSVNGSIGIQRVDPGVDGAVLVEAAWEQYPLGPDTLTKTFVQGVTYKVRPINPIGPTRAFVCPSTPTANYATLDWIYPLPEPDQWISKGDPGEDGSNVLPTDTAIAQAVDDDGSNSARAVNDRISAEVSPLVAAAIAADGTFAAAASAAVGDAIYIDYPSRNLYNPDAADNEPDTIISNIDGSALSSNTYTTTGFIPVTDGNQYTASNPRAVAYYDVSKAFLAGGYTASPSNTVLTTTAPSSAVYMRASFYTSYFGGTFQVEEGATATAYVPYGDVREIDTDFAQAVGAAIVSTGSLNATLTGTNLSIETDSGGSALVMTGQMDGGSNKVFNLWGASISGTTVHASNDEATPIRTQHSTIGANHGFSDLYAWATADHNKATADLGSVWTDGLRQYVLLAIDATGNAIFGGDYTTDGLGVDNMATTALTANLTHVSGATNTTALDYTKRQAAKTIQLYPAVQRIKQAVFVDGKPIAAGAASGRLVEVRESYDILHYGSLYDLAKANVGVSYTTLDVPGAVRVETYHKFGAGGVATVDVNLTEIRPTRLSQTGLVQTNALYSPATRYLPGVKTIGGFDWSTGVLLSSYSANQLVTTSDLWDVAVPPVMSIDVRADIAFVLGVHPWKPGVTTAAARIAEAPTNLWDLRDTDKSYPTVIAGEPAGWGRYEGHAVRAYLTPAQAAQVVGGTDALGAWAALETVVQLP